MIYMENVDLIKKMTLEEKASLCVGGSYWKSKGIERLGISEIVIDDYNGYVLENESNLFVDKIEYILENKSVYDSFSFNSKKKYSQELTADIMTERYLKIYKSIIKQLTSQ